MNLIYLINKKTIVDITAEHNFYTAAYAIQYQSRSLSGLAKEQVFHFCFRLSEQTKISCVTLHASDQYSSTHMDSVICSEMGMSPVPSIT